MTLRRTALTRRTELRRTPMPRGKRELKARTVQTIARQRDTGPARGVRDLVGARAGWACELCRVALRSGPGGRWLTDHSYHHRRPRGMGGSRRPDTNSPANLLLLCGSGATGCHGQIESHRSFAISMGWLLLQHQIPAAVPVVVDRGPATNAWVLLDDDGNYQEVTP